MPSIDERVVEMKFKDDQFRKGMAGASKSLGDFDKTLKAAGNAKGLQELDKTARGIKFDALLNGVQNLQSKFSALSIAGITALTNIANRAVDTGITLAKSLTIDPVKSGLAEYELQLGSIQTILANTRVSGTNLDDVNKALGELNDYADLTIYNFAEMTKNIGTFTAAGVGLDDSVAAIKGIANLAALSGSNSQQASGAMYQLSQAIAAGKVGLQDWNSVNTAGMGGSIFQRALTETAIKMGTLDKSAVKLQGSMKNVTVNGKAFRESLAAAPGKESWLTSKVLTSTLAHFTGDLTDAQLAAEGFSKAEIKSIQDTAASALAAAQEVKTLTAVIDTAQEIAGSGWAETWQIIFGDFNTAKTNFTDLSNFINGFIEDSSKARNEMFTEWAKLGGRETAIEGLKNAFDALASVINPIKDAFRDIFPPLTGQQLFDFTKGLADLVKSLTLSDEASRNLQRTFRGVFAALDIGWMIIKGLATVLLDLFGVVTDGAGGFLNFTGDIGDWIVTVRDAMKSGEGLQKFFEGLSDVVQKPIQFVQDLGRAIFDLFSGAGTGAVQSNPLAKAVTFISDMFVGLLDLLKGIAKFFSPLVSDIMGFFSDMGTDLNDMFSNLNFDQILDLINTGLFAGLVLIFKKFFGEGLFEGLKGLFGGGEGGFLENVTGVLEGVTGTLEAMQTNLKANTLMKIAGAIAILAGAVTLLSLIDGDKLAKALGGMTVMFLQLGGALLMFEAITKGPGFIKLPFIAASLLLLAGAILVLSFALTRLSKLDWDSLAKGLVGVGGLLGSLNLFMMFAKTSKRGIGQAAGLILLGIAINILGVAVGKFGEMDWQEIGKGLTTLGGVFALIAGFAALTGGGKALSGAGAGLVLMATAIMILVKPLKEFAGMSWEEIAKGLVTLGGALVILAGAAYLMTGTIPGSLAMVILATAIRILQPALEAFGNMEWEAIGKAMVVLGGSLLILAGAAYLMTGALPGAAAMLVIAAAIRMLTPALMDLGSLEWEEILKSLAMLAGALTVLGIAGILILPAIPGLLLLGVAITLLGAGTMMAGAGLMLFATALGVFAATGGLAIAVMVTAVKELLALIPFAAEQLGLGFVAFIQALSDNQVALIEGFTAIGVAILTSINELAPMIVSTLLMLVWLLINTIRDNVPNFVQAGADIIVGFLNGIANNIGNVVTAGANVIIRFLEGLQQNVGLVADEAAQTIVTFVGAAADAISANSGALQAEAARLGWAIVDGATGGLLSKAGELASAAWDLGKRAINSIAGAIDSNSPSKESRYLGEFLGDGFALGMDRRTKAVGDSAGALGTSALDSVSTAIAGIGSVLDSDMSLQPTITPVVDLSQVRKGAGDISGMMRNPHLDPELSRDRANILSDDEANYRELVGASPGRGSKTVIFNQTNNSPKALSTSEIYRQSNNLISRAEKDITENAD